MLGLLTLESAPYIVDHTMISTTMFEDSVLICS